MVSPFYFVIKPLGDNRYDNVKKFGGVDFIISASQEDYTVTNRFAVVEAVPLYYDGDISKGDIVVVHHNVFRIYYDVYGAERSSWNHFKDNIFLIDSDQVFLYKKEDGEWKSPMPYCFIKPVDNVDSEILTSSIEQRLIGVVKYIPENKLNIHKDDVVSFRPESEYEFKIDGEKLYRMRLNGLCLKV
jgi:hypothetical protein